MVLGAVPLAMAIGAGAESRKQIGWVIVGGLLLGTLLTLFVVPTAYTLIARDRAVLRAGSRRRTGPRSRTQQNSRLSGLIETPRRNSRLS